MYWRSIFKTMIIIAFILGLTGLVSAQTYIISGTVTDPNSNSIDSVRILMYTEEGDPLGQFVDTTDATGYYSITAVWPDNYGIAFRPSGDVYAPQFTAVVVEQSDIILDITLEFGNILSGTVEDTLGEGILDVDLNVYDQFTGEKLYTPGDNTNEAGFYDVVIPSGTYRIRYQYRGEDEDARYVPIELENVIITANKVIDVVFVEGYYVNGIVTAPGGVPVADADLDAENSVTGEKIFTPGDNTDEQGVYQLLLPPGTYDINVNPQISDRLVPEIKCGVQVFSDITLDFELESGFLLSGTVRDPDGIEVVDADLDVFDSITGEQPFTPGDNTDEQGVYQLLLPPGTYDISVNPQISDRLVPEIVYEIEVFSDITLDFQLESGFLLSGTVRDPDGNEVVDVDLDVFDSITGEKLFTPGDNTDEQGVYQLLLPPETYDISVNPQISDRLVPEIVYGIEVFSDITLDFELESGFLLSGTVRDPDGNEAVDVDLDVFDFNTGEQLFTTSDNTDINGFYQLVLPDSTFDIIYKPPVVPPYLAPIVEPGVVFNSDTIINVTLPFGLLLSGLIQNSSGVGVYGVDIDAEDAFSGIDVPLVGDHTDSSGEFSSALVPSAYHLEIEPPIQRRLEARKLFDFILNADTSIVESLDTGMVVSGIVSNQLGSPMADVRITAIESYTLHEIFLPGNMTNLQGFYQILIHSDTYNLIFTTPDLLDSIVFYYAEIARDTTIDISFYTTAPAVIVLAPNGGENWPAFSEQVISWTADDDVGVTSIEIFYSTNGLTGPFSLISIGEDDDGEYLWNVPPNLTDDARIKIVAYDSDNNSGVDISDNSFIIFQESSYYYYVPGDVNMALGLWPPSVIGGDVTYLVGYFIGGVQTPCMLDGFWASADVNGDCNIIGGDVTALVSYFISGGSISNCADYEPAWPPVPEEIPDDWPDCEPSVNNVKIIPSGTVK